MNLFEKKLSIDELKEIHKDVMFLEDFVNSALEIRTFNLLDYSSFGRSFSSFLADYNLPQLYRKFVTGYNETIKNEFSYDNNTINELISLGGFPTIFLRNSFFIKDLTDLFLKDKFKRESEFERSFYSSLKDWSDEWIVKRQQRIGIGISDLTIEYKNEKVAIELKKGVALNKDVLQASGYCRNDSGFSSILIAQKFDNETLKFAEELNVSCYAYCFGRPMNEEVPEFFVLDKVNDVGSKTKIHEELTEIDSCGGHTISFFKKADYVDVFHKSVEGNKNLIDKLLNILQTA